jgi:hypothetical protein
MFYLFLVLVRLVKGVEPDVSHGNEGVGIARARRCVQNSLELFLYRKTLNFISTSQVPTEF